MPLNPQQGHDREDHVTAASSPLQIRMERVKILDLTMPQDALPYRYIDDNHSVSDSGIQTLKITQVIFLARSQYFPSL